MRSDDCFDVTVSRFIVYWDKRLGNWKVKHKNDRHQYYHSLPNIEYDFISAAFMKGHECSDDHNFLL